MTTHYFKSFDRSSAVDGLYIAACGEAQDPKSHSTEPLCVGCAAWLADAGQRLSRDTDTTALLTHEAGFGPYTLTTYAPMFRVRTTHHFYTEAGREAFVPVAIAHGIVIESRGYQRAEQERAAS